MKRPLRLFLIGICFSIFLLSGYKLISTFLEYRNASQFYDETATQFVTSAPPVITKPEPAPTVPPSGTDISTSEVPVISETPEISDVAPIFVDFPMLLEISEHVIGWLYCEDTVINYPVVQSGNNSDYLRHMLDGTYNTCGTLFMDYRCQSDFRDGNSIIYGHNMRNGTMFNILVEYKDQAFYDDHPVMYFLTPDGNYAFYLFAGFVTPSDSWVYTFSFETKEAKEEYLQKCLENSLFTADFIPSADDPLMTLSTCSRDYGNARYVVMGILKPAY